MAAALLLLATVIVGQRYLQPGAGSSPQAGMPPSERTAQDALNQYNSKLKGEISELHAAYAASKREIAELRDDHSRMLLQIEALGKDLVGRRTENQVLGKSLAQLRDQNAQAASQNAADAQLLAQAQSDLDEARAHEKALEAESAAEKTEVATLAQQLSTKSTTIKHERELLAAGRDITDLMGARNLHIIDVRDADGKARIRSPLAGFSIRKENPSSFTHTILTVGKKRRPTTPLRFGESGLASPLPYEVSGYCIPTTKSRNGGHSPSMTHNSLLRSIQCS